MPQSRAHIEANARYAKKAYERVAFDLRRDAEINADYLRAYAKSRSESVNGFLIRAIKEAIERDSDPAAE